MAITEEKKEKSPLGHRVTEDAKREFDQAYLTVSLECLKDNVTITKEDFLEVLITLYSGKLTAKNFK